MPALEVAESTIQCSADAPCSRLAHSEQQAHHIIDELSRQLESLHTFNRHVAHDLRGPLLTVAQASRLAADALDRGEISAAMQMLSLAIRRTEGLNRLVHDLMVLAEGSHNGHLEELVDLTEVAEDAIAEIGPQELPAQHAVDIQLTRLPVVRGVPGLLKQVFVNLLSNAVKFTGKVATPKVELGTSWSEAAPVVYVSDNGVGIRQQDAARLFQPFSRLHGSAYPGSGVGLSLVRRVVERHGGRVWAEPGALGGATFLFTLSTDRMASACNFF